MCCGQGPTIIEIPVAVDSLAPLKNRQRHLSSRAEGRVACLQIRDKKQQKEEGELEEGQEMVEDGAQVEVDGDLLVLAVGNGRQAGGGRQLCPQACEPLPTTQPLLSGLLLAPVACFGCNRLVMEMAHQANQAADQFLVVVRGT